MMSRPIFPRLAQHAQNRASEPILPSRQTALDRIRASLDHGPVLLTGEPGAGKSWLASRIAAVCDWEPIRVEISPAATPGTLRHAIGRLLGTQPTDDAQAWREWLERETLEGRRHALVVDEVHTASDPVLEELRILLAFDWAAVLLVAQTQILQRLGRREHLGLASRLGDHVHLLPLDVDETRQFLAALAPVPSLDTQSIEAWQRDARGNPALLRQLLKRLSMAESAPPASSKPSVAVTLSVPTLGQLMPTQSPAEPRHLDENTIEVGWDDELDERAIDRGDAAAEETHDHPGVASGDEGDSPPQPVDDPYATLQAWDEWSRNRCLRSNAPRDDEAAEWLETDEVLIQDKGREKRLGTRQIRAEAEHEVASTSHLFPRSGKGGESST